MAQTPASVTGGESAFYEVSSLEGAMSGMPRPAAGRSNGIPVRRRFGGGRTVHRAVSSDDVMRRFPLRPIKTDADRAAAADVIRTLAAARDSLSRAEAEYLETLEILFGVASECQVRAVAASLSPRQREVLEALKLGASEKRIAGLLKISPHTVHVHVKAIYVKFQVSSRAELLSRWITGH